MSRVERAPSGVGDRLRRIGRGQRGIGHWLCAAALARAMAAGALSCQQPRFHIVLGQLYEADRDCVDPPTSIDIVDGPDPGLGCAPTCLVTPAGQNGAAKGVFVTTECGPAPDAAPVFAPQDDPSGTSPYCGPALAATARGDLCSLDGTSSCPAMRAGDSGVCTDASEPISEAGND